MQEQSETVNASTGNYNSTTPPKPPHLRIRDTRAWDRPVNRKQRLPELTHEQLVQLEPSVAAGYIRASELESAVMMENLKREREEEEKSFKNMGHRWALNWLCVVFNMLVMCGIIKDLWLGGMTTTGNMAPVIYFNLSIVVIVSVYHFLGLKRNGKKDNYNESY